MSVDVQTSLRIRSSGMVGDLESVEGGNVADGGWSSGWTVPECKSLGLIRSRRKARSPVGESASA